MLSGKIVGYLYITDVCPRFELEDLDADRVWRRYRENLVKKIPLYADMDDLDEEGNLPVRPDGDNGEALD